MTPEELAMSTGVGLSLIFNLIPGLKDWYDNFSTKGQKLLMVLFTSIVAVGLTFWKCTEPSNEGLGICLNGVDWRSLILTWFLTIGPNQIVDRVTPKPGDSQQVN